MKTNKGIETLMVRCTICYLRGKGKFLLAAKSIEGQSCQIKAMKEEKKEKEAKNCAKVG